VRASPSSSNVTAAPATFRVGARACLIAWIIVAAAGCATVRPEQRERLADPAMSFEAASMGQRHEQHVVENREGSSGGGTTRGGGCGCN
jgi:hypothetical protein